MVKTSDPAVCVVFTSVIFPLSVSVPILTGTAVAELNAYTDDVADFDTSAPWIFDDSVSFVVCAGVIVLVVDAGVIVVVVSAGEISFVVSAGVIVVVTSAGEISFVVSAGVIVTVVVIPGVVVTVSPAGVIALLSVPPCVTTSPCVRSSVPSCVSVLL